MRRSWMGGLALLMLCAMAASAQATEISGTVEVGADVLPEFGADAELVVKLSGEAWSVTSETDILLVPTFGIDECLLMSYDLDAIRLGADVDLSFLPFELGPVDVFVEADLFDVSIRDEDPAASLSSELAIGAVFDGAVSPYADLSTLFTLGSHWVSNTTTLSIEPLGVTSSLLAYLTTGAASLADGRVTVTAYGYVSGSVMPLDFAYLQLNAHAAVDGGSILNTVTYFGEDSFVAEVAVTLDLDAAAATVWGSFSSTASDPSGFGVSVSVPWGPL